MKAGIFLCAVLLAAAAHAQEFPVSWAALRDTATTGKEVARLAAEILSHDTGPDNGESLRDRYRLEAAAQHWNAVAPSLDRFCRFQYKDTANTKDVGLPYRLFAALRADKVSDTRFGEELERRFSRLLRTQQPETQSYIAQLGNHPPESFRNTYEATLRSLGQKPALTKKEASALCIDWTTYAISRRTYPALQRVLKRFEDERFSVLDTLLTLRSGARIAVTVTRSRAVTQPMPVALQYTIYPGREVFSGRIAVASGYVGVTATTRGKRSSPDAIEPFEHDADDSYEILDWIARQPWCNGCIGMYGGSYLGFSQWAAVRDPHPALKAIVPQVSVGAGIDFPCTNGIFMSYMLQWLHYVSDNKLLNEEARNDGAAWSGALEQYYKKGLAFNRLDALYGSPSALFQRWLSHPAYDAYWQRMTPQAEQFAAIRIPILTVTGYYDDDQGGAMSYYNRYFRYQPSGDHRLLIGPYDHGGAQAFPSGTLGGYTLDPGARIEIGPLLFKWFDHVMKGAPLPQELSGRVNFQVMGADRW
jgi:uncharacterized protein